MTPHDDEVWEVPPRASVARKNDRLPPAAASRLLIGLLIFVSAASTVRGDEPAEQVQFNRDIRPFLSDKCFRCHGPDANHREADLRLDLESSAKADRDVQAAIVPGKPLDSVLLQRVQSDDPDLLMPPPASGKSLTGAQIDLLRSWIEQGGGYQVHWSFAPAARPDLPTVTRRDWVRNEIDRFVLARLERQGLQPSPAADRATLVRRLFFDLSGLPPKPEEADAYLNADDEPRAYQQLVRRLLAAPHFGERMAMHWLDLVRYADTVGYHGDQEHNAAPYRDYVIASFNNNLPFDQFTIEQLAGDLLPNATEDQLVATAYNRLLQTTHEGGAQDQEYRAKYAADRVRNLAAVWLGATMGCAECHDHKYDPYTQRDFYQMAAFFADVSELGAFRGAARPPEIQVLLPADRDELAALRRALQEKLAPQPSAGSPPASAADERSRIAELRTRIATIEKRKRPVMVTSSVPPRTVRVLKRGDWLDQTGEVVQPGTPSFLPPLNVEGRRATRLDLARWLVSAEHPQTARVFVNRVWGLLLGSGFSNTLADNGSQGEWPTHPALLDYLATRFVADGWDVKALVRRIVMSSTYRQSSLATTELRKRDPDNRLFARQSPFRLPAEGVRDMALRTSGLLVDRQGGRTARPYQPAGYYAFLNFPKRTYAADQDENQYRRAVYMHWQRQFLHPMLRAFDAPSREECTARRPISNTPLAALTLMNDPSFVEAAHALACRTLLEGGEGDQQRLRWMWREVLTREARPREVESLAKLLQDSRAHYRADLQAAQRIRQVGLFRSPAKLEDAEAAAWTTAARAVLNLNEAITRN